MPSIADVFGGGPRSRPTSRWPSKLDDGRSVVRKVGNPDAVPHELVARWPYAFRPEGYDFGEPIHCPTC